MVEKEILKRLQEVETRYQDIEKILSDPSVNPSDIHRYSKEHSEISEVVEVYREYKKILTEIEENTLLLKDEELGKLAREEILILEDKQAKLEEKLRFLLLPK